MSDLQAASVQQAARERVRLLAAHLPPDMATDQQHVWHGQDAGKLAAWRAHEAAWATFSQAPPSATAAAAAAADVPWPPHLDGECVVMSGLTTLLSLQSHAQRGCVECSQH